MKPAFSYIRFSSPEQAKGDSFRRQSEKAAEWAAANGYTIVQSWADLGVSAYRGRNAEVGYFGEFLRAAVGGKLPEGSVLIIENLDRVSRQDPHIALSNFLRIIAAGVGIVALTDGQLHTKESLKKDPSGMALMVTLMVMVRANSESRVKGVRVAAAWENKRIRARETGVPLTDRVPNWLDSVRDKTGLRTFVENRHADTVRRIFAETAQGLGRRMIVKRLNLEGKDTFHAKNGWQTSTVAKVVASRTTLGEYQPCKRDEEGKSIPEGAPILGYYPAIVDEALWVRANAAIRLRRKNAGGRPQREGLNLIPGLGRCVCGSRMAFLNKGKPPKGGQYHACSAARRETGCTNTRLWRADAVERYLIHQIDPGRLDEAVEPAADPVGQALRDFDAIIGELEAKRENAIEAILRNGNSALGAEMDRRANALADQIAGVRKQRDAAAAEQRARPHLPTARAALQDVATLAATLESSSVDDKMDLRARITHQIRTAFAEIVFGPHTIVGLIALPGLPRSMKGAFGFPRPIIARPEKDGTQRWFYRHTLFVDDPTVLDAMEIDGGFLSGRFSGSR